MKALTKLVIGFAALAVMMTAMTVASFAADEKINVTLGSGIPGGYDIYRDVDVTADAFEEAFPDLKDAEAEGVTFADALVCAHKELYGDKLTDYLGFMDYGGGYIAVTKQFGRDYAGFYYVNNVSCPLGVTSTVVKDGDFLFAGSYLDGNYADLYGYFNKDEVRTKVGKTIKLNYKAGLSLGGEYEQVLELNTPTVKMLDIDLSFKKPNDEVKFKKVSGAKKAVYKDGKVVLNFKKAGIYFIGVQGKATYEGWDGTVTGKLASQIVGIEVDPAKPKMTKAKRTAPKKAVVAWKKVKGAYKYQVQYKKAGSKKWITKETKKNKITLTKLNAKKKYTVRVRATDQYEWAVSKYTKRVIKVK